MGSPNTAATSGGEGEGGKSWLGLACSCHDREFIAEPTSSAPSGRRSYTQTHLQQLRPAWRHTEPHTLPLTNNARTQDEASIGRQATMAGIYHPVHRRARITPKLAPRPPKAPCVKLVDFHGTTPGGQGDGDGGLDGSKQGRFNSAPTRTARTAQSTIYACVLAHMLVRSACITCRQIGAREGGGGGSGRVRAHRRTAVFASNTPPKRQRCQRSRMCRDGLPRCPNPVELALSPGLTLMLPWPGSCLSPCVDVLCMCFQASGRAHTHSPAHRLLRFSPSSREGTMSSRAELVYY